MHFGIRNQQVYWFNHNPPLPILQITKPGFWFTKKGERYMQGRPTSKPKQQTTAVRYRRASHNSCKHYKSKQAAQTKPQQLQSKPKQQAAQPAIRTTPKLQHK